MPHDLVRLAVGVLDPVETVVVVAGVDHGEHHICCGDEVFPYLPDAEVDVGAGGHAEHVDREGCSQRVHALAQQFEVPCHAATSTLPLAPGRKDGTLQPGLGLVREAHVIELHFAEPHAHGFFGQVRGVDPHRVVEGVHPGEVQAIPPQASVCVTDRPVHLLLGQQRVLGDDDAGNRIDALGVHQAEALPGVPRPTLVVRPDLDRCGHCRSVGQIASVVLHIDDEGVDLRRVGESNQIVKPATAEDPGVEVDRPDTRRRFQQRRRRPSDDGLGAVTRCLCPGRQSQLVAPVGRALCRQARAPQACEEKRGEIEESKSAHNTCRSGKRRALVKVSQSSVRSCPPQPETPGSPSQVALWGGGLQDSLWTLGIFSGRRYDSPAGLGSSRSRENRRTPNLSPAPGRWPAHRAPRTAHL